MKKFSIYAMTAAAALTMTGAMPFSSLAAQNTYQMRRGNVIVIGGNGNRAGGCSGADFGASLGASLGAGSSGCSLDSLISNGLGAECLISGGSGSSCSGSGCLIPGGSGSGCLGSGCLTPGGSGSGCLGSGCLIPGGSGSDNSGAGGATPEFPGTQTPNLPGTGGSTNDGSTGNRPGSGDSGNSGSTSNKPGTGDTTTADSAAAEILSLVNAERAKAGLAPLTLNSEVSKAASIRANEIQTSFSHTRPGGKSFSTVLTEAGISYRASGENIAYGQTTAAKVMSDWMNSSGHRANILNSSYTELGVGHVKDASGTDYWVQLFIN